MIYRDENEALKNELRDIQSRLSEDYCKTNVRKIVLYVTFNVSSYFLFPGNKRRFDCKKLWDHEQFLHVIK